MIADIVTVLGAALVGLVAGAFLPRLVAVIPDRPVGRDEPSPTPYRELATAPRLAALLGLATATCWALLVIARGLGPDLLAYLMVASAGVALSYVDIREHRLPDWLNYSTFVGATALLAGAAAVDGAWAHFSRALFSAAVMTACYFLLALARPGELGLGDVKLAATIGLVLGWVGWAEVVVGAFLGFLCGGVFSLALVVAGRADRRTQLPFGPFMLLGALAAVLWGGTLADAYLGR